VVGRYAPSPTGDLHLGNLRTALIAWMYARSAGSPFLVRMEDLDASRVRAGYAEQQLADLRAVGVDWDGEVVFQSARTSLYEDALDRLREAGLLYECFCTRAEIRAAVEAPHGPSGEGAYPGTCLRLTEAEREVRRAERPPALRVRARGASVRFEDGLLGQLSGAVGDFVVRRNDGAFAYNLAVVVDDGLQGVQQVVRGDDLADSTPSQLWLAHQLGLPAPAFAHVPLVLGPDGSRLAKRHGSVTLRDVPAGDAVRWIASSLRMEGARSAADMLAAFDPAALPRDPTVFDRNPGPVH
jgi:glutamyl-tRNA synthetase